MSSSISSSSSAGGEAGLKKSKKEGAGIVFLTMRVCFVSVENVSLLTWMAGVETHSYSSASCSRPSPSGPSRASSRSCRLLRGHR